MLSLPVWTRSVAFLCPRELTPALEDCCSATAWVLLDEKRQNLNQAWAYLNVPLAGGPMHLACWLGRAQQPQR